ncbi:hypothetical protein CHARACLAT_027043 [Characodon lateralis]|uniref:Uncharacterized protein n=1 Tax=Characodon lateralis TaxID=208331 RepID=A0ABU7CRL6_9TELE|nr:hypothetical protein [Characodon lateralis]
MKCVQTFGLYCMSALNIHLCPLFLQKQLKLSKYCIEIIREHQFSSYVKDTQLDFSIDFDRAIQTQNKISPKYFSVTLMGGLELEGEPLPQSQVFAASDRFYCCFISVLQMFHLPINSDQLPCPCPCLPVGKSSHSMSLPPTHLILRTIL